MARRTTLRAGGCGCADGSAGGGQALQHFAPKRNTFDIVLRKFKKHKPLTYLTN